LSPEGATFSCVLKFTFTPKACIILSGSLSITGSIHGNLTGTASNSVSSSFAVTSSYALNSENSIFANTASYSTSASYAETASYSIIHVESITSSSFAETASYAVTASHALSTNLPYKVYTALLTQEGENAPVATVLENTVGSIVIDYDSIGGYYIESPSFENSKTLVLIGSLSSLDHTWFAQCYEPQIYINTFDSGIASDSILNNASIEIRVYN
jgi:hypothetical protein